VLFANIMYSYYLLYKINITFSTPIGSFSVLKRALCMYLTIN